MRAAASLYRKLPEGKTGTFPAMESPQELRELLGAIRRVAVVGVSGEPTRPSHEVAAFLITHSHFEVDLVNPHEREVFGRPCYPSLQALPERPDLVDVFRRPPALPEVARDAVRVGAKALWLQEGLISAEAKRIAEDAGLAVVMDRCLKVDYRNLAPMPEGG